MEIFGMDFGCVIGSLRHGQIPEKDCLLPLISKLLGYCIVAASTTVKIPQILKILEHKSVRGLSVVAFELEVIGYTISLAYCLHKGLPFSAFGEYAFLLVQGKLSSILTCNLTILATFTIKLLINSFLLAAIILVGVIYYFSQPVGTSRWMRALLYCGLAPTILSGKIDPMLFEALYVRYSSMASQHAIFLCARIPQIWKNFSVS
ncbi:Mannose-P-dolichol utilization defect 1 protein-like protein 2 [Bienertia sinuspersici]